MILPAVFHFCREGGVTVSEGGPVLLPPLNAMGMSSDDVPYTSAGPVVFDVLVEASHTGGRQRFHVFASAAVYGLGNRDNPTPSIMLVQAFRAHWRRRSESRSNCCCFRDSCVAIGLGDFSGRNTRGSRLAGSEGKRPGFAATVVGRAPRG